MSQTVMIIGLNATQQVSLGQIGNRRIVEVLSKCIGKLLSVVLVELFKLAQDFEDFYAPRSYGNTAPLICVRGPT
jgi:hypothetical protein